MITALSLTNFHSSVVLLLADLLARPVLKVNTVKNGWQEGIIIVFSV